MKKEIEELLKQENGSIILNDFCELKRWRCGAMSEIEVDQMCLTFSILSMFDITYQIKARDYQGIVEEIAQRQIDAFNEAGEKLAKELRNGYMRKGETKFDVPFSEEIAQDIERLGLTQKAFAEKLDIPLRTIENWKSGARIPTAMSKMGYRSAIKKLEKEG